VAELQQYLQARLTGPVPLDLATDAAAATAEASVDAPAN
jgi:hypothetical protein